MKAFFNLITRLSVRFRALTLLTVVLVVILGVTAGTQLNQELLPPVEFPQTFILAQASGMTSEQVLNVLTQRLEVELSQIPEIVNLDSQTNGAFGAFLIAANDFGLDQDQLIADIQAAIDRVWLPSRRIAPPEGVDPAQFAEEHLAELPADVLLYLAERNSNFLFQLSPEVWQRLNEDAVRELIAYLATQQATDEADQSALERLVEQEIVPQIAAVDLVANVSVAGGQVLPGEEDQGLQTAGADQANTSQLLQLSPDVWRVISERLNLPPQLGPEAVEAARGDYSIPESVPMLPESWQLDRYIDATDLVEVAGAARPIATVLNEFQSTGVIQGPLGRTNDLTPEDVTRLLEIEPSLVEYFDADQLTTMSPEVFAALPDEYIDGLDGFTRDELAAAALAQEITGDNVIGAAARLPAAWRIPSPQIIRFSFADIPLATFSVFSNGGFEAVAATDSPDKPADTTSPNDPQDGAEDNAAQKLPEGPELPQIFDLFGSVLGVEIDSADDLIGLQLPPDAAELLGSERLPAAQLFNTLLLFGDAAAFGAGGEGEAAAPGLDLSGVDLTTLTPALNECGVGLLAIANGNFNLAETIIGCVGADAYAYLVENDPGFVQSLDAEVFSYLSDDALFNVPGLSPPLGDAWDTLARQPEFGEASLQTADDLLTLGNGAASGILNQINAGIPARFEGYEIRLFDSLSLETVRYLAHQEPDFYTNLDPDVIVKFSPEVLSNLPQSALEAYPDDVQQQIEQIASGEIPSAAQILADRYVTDVVPADPTAPALNSEWQFIGGFLNIELNNAFDLFRFEDVTGTPSEFVNGLFSTPGGANFAPGLLGNLSQEAFDFIVERDPDFVQELEPQALLLLPESIFNNLPQTIQDKASAGEVFVPSTTVTRTNGSSSLLVTVFKDADANTVEAFYTVKEVIDAIDAANDNISIEVAFEQSSFIEESITGVVREGSLGAFFAIINILIFLSGGVWGWRGRRLVGAIILVVSAALLMLVISPNLAAADGDLVRAFERSDVLTRVLTILGVIAGFLIITWPGKLPYPSWRSTLVIGISIPFSILAALALMRWLPPVIATLLSGFDGPVVDFILRLAPEDLTLNIMTLSGLTVAIGRIVDDSIVVLENIFRQLQTGMDKREAILSGTRDVSLAIFSATGIAVVVFLPLGLTGGLIGEFFLPFGLAVTYSLISSFIVAITVVPALAYLLIEPEHVPPEEESWMQRAYVPILRVSLGTQAARVLVIFLAFVSAGAGFLLFATRPAAFLPDFGEPQISVVAGLPEGTPITETDVLVREMETRIRDIIPDEELKTVRTIIGGGGLNFESLIGGGGGVAENEADITIGLNSPGLLDNFVGDVRAAAVEVFGAENVEVSAASLTSGSGFGGFELVMSGPDQEVLAEFDPQVIEILNSIEGITNVESNLAAAAAAGDDGPQTYIRVNQRPALSYTGELETEDTIGITRVAITTLEENLEFPEGVRISQGFNSEIQTEGFASIIVAIGIASVIVVAILVILFGSPVYWVSIFLSVVVAPVGAAVALTLTNRVLGISALIGLLMLLGLVITNAIVLIDRVGSNRTERGMDLYEALIEAGARRVRPILMTALATIIALIPLAVGLSEGAIIASELGTVVIGGVLSSTVLTLIVVPAAYYLLTPLHEGFMRMIGRRRRDESPAKN